MCQDVQILVEGQFLYGWWIGKYRLILVHVSTDTGCIMARGGALGDIWAAQHAVPGLPVQSVEEEAGPFGEHCSLSSLIQLVQIALSTYCLGSSGELEICEVKYCEYPAKSECRLTLSNLNPTCIVHSALRHWFTFLFHSLTPFFFCSCYGFCYFFYLLPGCTVTCHHFGHDIHCWDP